MSNRRDFLKKSSLLGLASIATNLIGQDKIDKAELALSTLGENAIGAAH